MKTRNAVFLDRDGVINIDKAYVYKIEDFTFCACVSEASRYFQSLGYLLIIVSNQSGIGRRYYTEEDFKILTSGSAQSFYALALTLMLCIIVRMRQNKNVNVANPKVACLKRRYKH